MTRLIQWISDAVRDVDSQPEVHFHRGYQLQPVVCYDRHCGAPRLDVSSG